MKRLAAILATLGVPLGIALGGLSANAFTPPGPLDVNAAVEKGVAYLDTRQNTDGSFGDNYPIAETALALISYGVRDQGDYTTLSAARQTKVKNAVAWLLSQQTTNASDSNGVFGPADEYPTYYTGLALAALSFSKGTNAGVTNGITAGRSALIALFQGPTHKPTEACTTVTNWQYCGGYNYDFGTGRSDESNTGFGLTGLELTGGVPAALATLDVGWQRNVQEIASNTHATQADGGGSYQPGTDYTPFVSNANDTGSLLFGYGYDGVPAADAGVQAGIKFANDVLDVYELTKATRDGVYHAATNEEAACVPGANGCHWQFEGSSEGGYHYSMWSLSKGIGEYVSPNLADTSNFYAKVADLLVTQQSADGSWPQNGRDDASVIGATGFSIFALGLAAVPPPAVSGFTASSFHSGGTCSAVHLSWTNPAAPNYGGVQIVRRTDRSPNSPSDGTVVVRANRPATTFDDKGLAVNTTYYYGAFSYDTTGSLYGPEATATTNTTTCGDGAGVVALPATGGGVPLWPLGAMLLISGLGLVMIKRISLPRWGRVGVGAR